MILLTSNFFAYSKFLWLQKCSFRNHFAQLSVFLFNSIWITILHMYVPFAQQSRSALPFTGVRENTFFWITWKAPSVSCTNIAIRLDSSEIRMEWLDFDICLCCFMLFYSNNHSKGGPKLLQEHYLFDGDLVHIYSLSFWWFFSDSIFIFFLLWKIIFILNYFSFMIDFFFL